jgi:hypothetical protein
MIPVFSPFFLSMHIVEYQEQEGGYHMRFLYKRRPAEELQLEIDDVRQIMCSGSLVMFDLLFYSFLFALLMMPVKASLLHFSASFIFVYVLFAFIFILVRKAMNKNRDNKDLRG